MGFLVPHLWYGKVQTGLTPDIDVQERRKKKESLLLPRAGLSSCLYRLRTICVNLSMVGVVSTSPHDTENWCRRVQPLLWTVSSNAHRNCSPAVCPRTPQPNCASHPISCPIVLFDPDESYYSQAFTSGTISTIGFDESSVSTNSINQSTSKPPTDGLKPALLVSHA
jgi:hypothetical protein